MIQLRILQRGEDWKARLCGHAVFLARPESALAGDGAQPHDKKQK